MWGRILIADDVCGKTKPNLNAILMLKGCDRIVWATACGDNCAKWILEIAKQKDLTICLSHIMEFEEDFERYCIDNHLSVQDILELKDYVVS